MSGGPDSMAALALAAEAGVAALALTVDHGLRPASAAEAAAVARACTALGVPHATLAWGGAKPAGNVQAAARAARYRLLRDACARAGLAWLVTAHHADDQAETVLMRLARGAGPAGLAGVRPRRALGRGVTVVRPLLGWRKAELEAVCAARGLAAARDPANADPAYDRTRARALLAATPWLDPARAAASAEHLCDAEDALAWVADLAWRTRATVSELVELDAHGLPRAVALRLVARALTHLVPGARPRGPELARLADALAAGGAATLAGVAARGGRVWRFAPEAGRIASAPAAPHVVHNAKGT